jgi:hypothetical protein
VSIVRSASARRYERRPGAGSASLCRARRDPCAGPDGDRRSPSGARPIPQVDPNR